MRMFGNVKTVSITSHLTEFAAMLKSEWVADFRDENDACINFEEGKWKHEQKTKKKPD